ncbi:MAG: hypothetical protein RLZZ562_2739 [Planctomycetota bacterium]|jgi:4'-phosphopantetheinyl transferase
MDDVSILDSFREFTPGHMALSDHEVHVYAVPLAGDGERYAEWLSKDEVVRADRYRILDHRRRYTIAHGALRIVLGCYLSKDPASLEFDYGTRGKPALRGDGPHFNLSHSAHLAMIAVAQQPVGIDCEKTRRLERLLDIGKRQFATAEYVALQKLPEADRLQAFYRCWTRKEAYVKALGLGLAALDVFDVDLGEKPQFLELRDGEDIATWSLLDVSPSTDFTAACAVRMPRAKAVTYRFGAL